LHCNRTQHVHGPVVCGAYHVHALTSASYQSPMHRGVDAMVGVCGDAGNPKGQNTMNDKTRHALMAHAPSPTSRLLWYLFPPVHAGMQRTLALCTGLNERTITRAPTSDWTPQGATPTPPRRKRFARVRGVSSTVAAAPSAKSTTNLLVGTTSRLQFTRHSRESVTRAPTPHAHLSPSLGIPLTPCSSLEERMVM